MSIIEPSHVLVIDGNGYKERALWGSILNKLAVRLKVGGVIIDGAVRDMEAFLEVNLPVFAAGVSHRGPYKDGPGEINVSVAIDGMVIEPGDLVIGDWDGVLSIPLDDVDSILKKTNEKQAAEAVDMAKIEAGEWDRSWVDKTLKDRGCIMP